MKYVPALDGLRAMAALGVVCFHSGAPWAQGGSVGVDVFFVLSGFLITSQLTSELYATGHVCLGAFYWRRAIRLYPALLMMLASVVAVAPFAWPDVPILLNAVLAALYVTDYARAFGMVTKVLPHTWSLSVEEHFYLVWPLILPLILRLQHHVRCLLALFVAATLWRVCNYWALGWDLVYFRFDTRMSGILLGSTIALLPSMPVVPRIAPIAALAMLALLVALPNHREPVGMYVSIFAAELSTALLIVGIMNSFRVSVLESAPLRYLGKLSYGIYLWHLPVMHLLSGSWLVNLAVGGVASILLAAASYHVLEQPLQKRLRTRRTPPTIAIDAKPTHTAR